MDNKIIIFSLLFILLFNFSLIPVVNAEALTMSYGLYVFLKACIATGVSVSTLIVADKVTDEGVKLYKEWQEFNNKSPDPMNDNNFKNAIANILGIGLIDNFQDLISSTSDFFRSINSVSGDNYYDPLVNIKRTDGKFLSINETYNVSDGSTFLFTLAGDSITVKFNNRGNRNQLYIDVSSNSSSLDYGANLSSADFIVYSISKSDSAITLSYKFGPFSRTTAELEYNSNEPDIALPPSEKSINYNIVNNSYILTNDNDDLKPSYPDIELLPNDKIEPIATPYGYYDKYIGDDLLDDYLNNIPNLHPNDLIDPLPGRFVNTDYGVVFVPDGNPVPGPIINPNPIPSDPVDPNPIPDPIPYPDTFPTDPYPEIVEEDVLIPTGLGKIIALLKQLVNWSSRLFNKDKIDNELEEKEDPLDIPNKLVFDFSPLQNLGISEKFPFCLPFDLKNSIDLLVSPPKPPKWDVPIYSESIVIDLSEFESLALISRSFFSLLFVIAMIVMTRRFIGGA